MLSIKSVFDILASRYDFYHIVNVNQTVNLDSSVGLRVLQLGGANTNGRFGSAVATLDFNLDGILDIVVSAPGVHMEDMDYYGQVINLLWFDDCAPPTKPLLFL